MVLALVCASIAALLLRAPSPLEPVADTVMDRTPVSIAIPLLLHLGPLARPLALWGAAMVALLAGGLIALVYPHPGNPHPQPLSRARERGEGTTDHPEFVRERGEDAAPHWERGRLARLVRPPHWERGRLARLVRPPRWVRTPTRTAAIEAGGPPALPVDEAGGRPALPVDEAGERPALPVDQGFDDDTHALFVPPLSRARERRAGPAIPRLGIGGPVSHGRGSEGLRVVIAVGLLADLATLVVPRQHAIVALVLVLAYVGGLHLLARETPVAPGRRGFLVHNGRIVAGLGVLVALLYIAPWAYALRTGSAGRRLFAWTPRPPRKPGFDLPGLTPEVSAVGDAADGHAFYQMDEDLQRPDVDISAWSLSVEGLVQRPQRLSFADLLALPRRDQLVTQECVSNPVGGPLISTALFSGVPIAALLDQTGVASGATAVLFRSPDGHEEAIPLALARDPRVLLAYGMNGALLEQAHGFPARALLPGLYGYKGVKWVDTVRLTDDPRAGYWERNGWVALPEAHTMARIDVARRVPEGLLVAGVAFAGRRGVRAVQVRVNRGPWRLAELHTPALSPLTWVQWRLTLPARGIVTLQARAIDGAGRVQTDTVHDQYPSGATGYHTVSVRA